MEEFINSGILELYIFGVTTEEENKEVQEMAARHEEVKAEILSIEKAIVNLSYSVSPHLSPDVYHRIRKELIEKHSEESGVIQLQPSRSSGVSGYIGWAAAIVLLFGLGIQYYMYEGETGKVQSANKQRDKFEQMVAAIEKENNIHKEKLDLIRDKNNVAVPLAGQEVAPNAYAKMYVNNAKKEIYVDIAGLPEAPQGKEYQVWALMLDPLTPTSIGVLTKEQIAENKGIIKVDNFDGVQAFGITLEPVGGSASPTMEQLYTLGKV
ncbi:anti-sigma factor [Flavobacterium sp. DG1-102-2]|uniref:anti-sigma factor n=1 Tax=Flavobacterium sp. DG1-102-2 TaxID=3081663 RepID=UPI002948C900|nr:anti-sigma factor [Flavobacterium sp. DG1-102-2]MDV6168612.1 anti-sigma factor [Flavobacterium sp. DG1-102-2]